MIGSSPSLLAADFPPVEQLPVQTALPDPLTMLDGTKVTTAEQWRTQRRPELIRMIEHYMYGRAPAAPQIATTVTKTVDAVLNGTATLKEVEIRFIGLPDSAPKLHLALFLPKDARSPAPVFLGINSCGNAEVVADDAVTIDPEIINTDKCPNPVRGSKADFWCVDGLISRGYAFATFHQSDLDPDKPDFTDGIHPFYPEIPAAAESRWGTIAAWAWGFQRCVDYLVTDPAIDPQRVCLIGHSRRGKTALWAAALDERVALVVPHQSGTGGMALSRDSQQETVERINRVFPHWFDDAFVAFGDNEARLPFDQHCVVALVAPRHLLDTEGSQDAWANFPRSLDSLQGADPVYQLLGARGLVGTGLVQDAEPIVGPNFGTILQYRLNEKHTLNRQFWNKILDFADASLN
ncbi:MAG: hypothetical protein B7Z55_01745 [Planctomycetales bacterium 12-60-4]|nr:MAG: hypothetical protein B7Z55_01745 [Planctomycetales bacterium 12-60-4]